MDFMTILGIIIGLFSLIVGYMWDDGSLGALFVPSALLIVLGGTIGAVVISFSAQKLKKIPTALKLAFFEKKIDNNEEIEEMVNMAATARREGVLSLEEYVQKHETHFLREGMLMVVDGTDPELTRQILELEIDSMQQKQEEYAKIFEAAGGFAPTMGIIGTVMGLIHVLGNVDDPTNLAPAIAVAFSATLYGVMSANIIFIPIANKIRMRTREQIISFELMLEGVLSIQAGENPQLIRKKLMSFVDEKQAPVLGKDVR
ncbi:flagellar motor protein [Longirhabdus pacifica]|uniref:flagellar motor protein n=1 Tax=Longirhabdus pacifica TaxID=2305227 RepID=UPI001008C6BD|nr:flagellar motor protein [Longirhabdus pacifica]